MVKDDFQSIFEEMLQTDAIFLETPVYHASITAEVKPLLDWAGFSGCWAANAMKATDENYQWAGNVFSGKIVEPVAIDRCTGQTLALAELLMWAACNDCIIFGNTYWNMGVAGKGGAVNTVEDKEETRIMRSMAERVVCIWNKLNGQG